MRQRMGDYWMNLRSRGGGCDGGEYARDSGSLSIGMESGKNEGRVGDECDVKSNRTRKK